MQLFTLSKRLYSGGFVCGSNTLHCTHLPEKEIPFMAALFFLFLLVGLILVLGSVFWIWMLVDCINNRRLSDTTKAVWVLIIIFTHFIGALCYLLFARNQQQSPYVQYQQPLYTQYQQPSGFQQPGGGLYPQGHQQGGYPLYQAPAQTPPQPGQAQSMPHTSYYQFAPEALQQPGGAQPVPYQHGYQPQTPTPSAPSTPIQEWRQEDEPLATYPEMPQQQQSNFE
jgi:hypothetical protein